MDSKWPDQAVVTLVEKQKRGKHRYSIFLDDDYAFSVHEDILIRHQIRKGKPMKKSEIEEVLADEMQHHVYADALRFLGRRQYAKAELFERLVQKDYDQETVHEVIARLEREKLVDDRQFAEMWSRHRLYGQKKGRFWVRQELKQKGVSDEWIEQALRDLDSDREMEIAAELAHKKWLQLKDKKIPQKIQKTAAYLARRGYSQELIYQIISELRSSDTRSL